MESWYDEEDDIWNVRINDGIYWKSIELDNGAVIDISKDGLLLGIEILRASKVFSKAKNVLENAQKA